MAIAASAVEISGVDQLFRTGFWLKKARVLNQISFTIPEKSVFGFLGANGAGKTTLINLIVGIRRPSSGTVKVFGYEASSPEARSRIGFLPERPYFHDHLTGDGFLDYFGALSGMSRAQVRDRATAVLSSVGMLHARRTELRKYSKGMLQRIGMAQALLHDPELLVLDEPMSGLDPLGRKEMRELIGRLASEGRTIFFSSHVIPDVEAICDQVALIQKGALISSGRITDLLSRGPVQIEIGFSGLSLEEARRISVLEAVAEIPDALKAMVSSQASLQLALHQLLSARANVLWVNPIRHSLEELFGVSQEKKS